MLPVTVTELIQKLPECPGLCVIDFESGHHLPYDAPLGAVMKHGDIPTVAQGAQKSPERAGMLGKFKLEHPFYHDAAGFAANHETHVLLGKLVIRKVDKIILQGVELFFDTLQLRHALGQLECHVDMGIFSINVAIVEFRNGPAADGLTETAKTAFDLSHGHRQHRFAALTKRGALGHVTQSVEIHVGTGKYRGGLYAFEMILLQVFF